MRRAILSIVIVAIIAVVFMSSSEPEAAQSIGHYQVYFPLVYSESTDHNPVLVSVEPSIGIIPGGTITITGVHLGTNQSSIDGKLIIAGMVAPLIWSWSDTQIALPVPVYAPIGTWLLLVLRHNQAGEYVQSNALNYPVLGTPTPTPTNTPTVTPTPIPPSITSVDPPGGAQRGEFITINGMSLGESQSVVNGSIIIAAATASSFSWADTSITTFVPSTALTGTHSLYVVARGQQSNVITYTISP